ncbi:SIR2 family protein [Phyllobacterium sp. SB3]|uniref:SIR2 family protein n=1 Tax=Phyllobacterium sp. SB3 TaxID=3156073 RepID=UPI0032AF84A0
MPIKTISAAQFATVFDLRPNLVAWFLGAGASAASGIPTGYAMIRDFKAQIFCRETNLSKREIDTADPIWIDRIDAFFRQNSQLPPDGDPTEYAKAFEAVYPEARHRRQYIDDAISKGTPCFGHKVLGSLMAAGKVDSVFTTNFDPLIEESAHSANAILPVDDQNRPTVAAIDSANRAMRCLNESDWPLVAKLHGDYQSIAIKNTGSELEEQDARMRHVLVESGKRFGMIFVGYSGRDASIMEALNRVLDTPSPFPNGLYWLTSSASRLLPAVIEFLERAEAADVDVAVVECATFDELAADIIKVTDLPKPLLDRVMEGRPTPRLVPVQIPNAKARAFPVLRYSAILLQSMPTAARRIRLSRPTTSAEVREIFKAKGCRATAAVDGPGQSPRLGGRRCHSRRAAAGLLADCTPVFGHAVDHLCRAVLSRPVRNAEFARRPFTASMPKFHTVDRSPAMVVQGQRRFHAIPPDYRSHRGEPEPDVACPCMWWCRNRPTDGICSSRRSHGWSSFFPKGRTTRLIRSMRSTGRESSSRRRSGFSWTIWNLRSNLDSQIVASETKGGAIIFYPPEYGSKIAAGVCRNASTVTCETVRKHRARPPRRRSYL